MIKCPECSTELIRWKIQEENSFREVWMHPPPLKDCAFKNDGLKITTDVADEYLLQKFQDLIEREGIKDEIAFKGENLNLNVKNSSENVVFKSNEEIIKRRLSKGIISVSEFKEIKELIKEKWE